MKIESSIKPGDGINAPLRVVLHNATCGSMPYVTHIENCQVGGYSHGNYFETLDGAKQDFKKRCREYGVHCEEGVLSVQENWSI